MITSSAMHRRACRVVSDLERRVKSGTATDADRKRYSAGVDHLLVFEWAQEGERFRVREHAAA